MPMPPVGAGVHLPVHAPRSRTGLARGCDPRPAHRQALPVALHPSQPPHPHATTQRPREARRMRPKRYVTELPKWSTSFRTSSGSGPVMNHLIQCSARGRTRTDTSFRSRHFKCRAPGFGRTPGSLHPRQCDPSKQRRRAARSRLSPCSIACDGYARGHTLDRTDR